MSRNAVTRSIQGVPPLSSFLAIRQLGNGSVVASVLPDIDRQRKGGVLNRKEQMFNVVVKMGLYLRQLGLTYADVVFVQAMFKESLRGIGHFTSNLEDAVVRATVPPVVSVMAVSALPLGAEIHVIFFAERRPPPGFLERPETR